MGSIRKTKAGTYFATAYDCNGNRFRKTFEKKSQAQNYIRNIESTKHDHSIDNSKITFPQTTFDDAITNFILTKNHLRPKTHQRYKLILDRFTAFLRDNQITYLNEFKPDHASLFYHTLKNSYPKSGDPSKVVALHPKTINFSLQIIRALFNLEVEIGHIDRSPFLHIKNMKVNKPRPEFYTEAELNQFFNQKMHETYRYAFLALLHTGLRINELINLTWDDVDIEKRLIYIRPKEGIKLKTDNAQRIIPVNDTLLDVLITLQGKSKSEIYPFCSINGKKLRERKLLTICKEIGNSAGIKSRVFLHKFRHTFATHLVKRRVPIEAIQKLLGHSNIQQSMVYLHIRSEELHSDVALLNDLGSMNQIPVKSENPEV